MTTVQEEGQLITKLPQFIMIGIILVMFASYFIEGGLGPVTEWKRWASMLRPFSFVVIAISMIRTEFGNIFSRRKGWQFSIITMGTYILFMLLALSPKDSTLGSLYLLFHETP